MRKSVIITTVLLAAGAGLPTAMYAEETQNSAAVFGPGSSTCREFTLTYEHSPDATGHAHADDAIATGYKTSDYIQWLQGYLSAYNIYAFSGDDVTNRTNMASILRFLYNMCRERPYDNFISAIPDVLNQIRPGQ